NLFIISGNGDVIEPDDGIAGIGSGGSFAVAAAKALFRNTNMTAEEIVRESLKIASELCVYTNDQYCVEKL
ncbi:HslU--HslV peptidase proteolytic subunit, partial [Dolichospermum sp. ST_sed4]|nr:HslU--HslV peptidase proteolytic subunit [Dolichospermum sp. ST_sed4]